MFEFHDLKRESFESKYICQRDSQIIDTLSAEKFTSIYSYENRRSLLFRFIKPAPDQFLSFNCWWNYFPDAGTIGAVFDPHQEKLEELYDQLIDEEYEINLTLMSTKMVLIRELNWHKILDLIVLPEIVDNIIGYMKMLV